MSYTLTILTSTYNRAHALPQLYQSLLKQADKRFEWVVVDDGSTDETEQLIDQFTQESQLTIKYLKQENKGKHVALNTGIKEIESELTFIVDSDDYLTQDATDIILKKWQTVEKNNLCGISFLKGYTEEKVIGSPYPEKEMIANFINLRANQGVSGDKAEIWKTSLLKKYPFPQFEGEKFIGEAYVWYQIAKSYDMLFVNQIIYVAEYLTDGLTKSGRLLRIKCPLGGMAHSEMAMSTEFRMKVRVKNTWLFVCYGLFAKKNFSTIFRITEHKSLVFFNFLFGYMLYHYWKLKYKVR